MISKVNFSIKNKDKKNLRETLFNSFLKKNYFNSTSAPAASN